jgi:hypothetical protein
VRHVFTAGSLVGNVAALAETVREINGTLRQRAGLEGNDLSAPALPGATAQEETSEAGASPAGPRNGRRRAGGATG